MASDWRYLQLKDVIDLVADNRGRNPESYSSKGIPVIDNYLIISEGYINLNEVKRYIDESTYENFIRKHIQENDVLVTLVGNGYGQVALTPSAKCVIIQNTIGLRCNSSHDNVFLYYLLKNNRKALMNLNIGAAQPSIKVGDLTNLEFQFPPLPEQKAIAHILGSLDDKIELNRQMNETLETMAQALFKSWFVDFDPVIDNALAAGNAIPDEFAKRAEQRKDIEKKGNSDIQDLFPNEFELSEEMGWVPKGWVVSSVGTEFNTVGGGTPSTKNPDFWENGDISWTTPKDLSGNQSKVLLHTDRKITESGLNKISSGLLPIDTVLMSSRAPVGYLALAKVPVAINQGYIALKCEKTLTPEFAIQWADSAMDEIKQRAGGTTFAEISKTNFRGIPVLVPNQDIIDAYSRDVKDLYNQITSRIENIDTLSILRDTLLPKLMSGELRIPNGAGVNRPGIVGDSTF